MTNSTAPAEPSPAQIASACLSYRHDFGLMDRNARERLMIEAKAWLHAWRKEFEVAPDAPKGEPTCYALRFPHDPRLNLSTVFDTEEEAKDYAERCDGASVVPLYERGASSASTPHGAREATAFEKLASEQRSLTAEENAVLQAAMWDSAEIVHPGKLAREPAQLPESMSRDEMLKYYSEYANVQSNEALRYQKRIRDLEAALKAREPSEDTLRASTVCVAMETLDLIQ